MTVDAVLAGVAAVFFGLWAVERLARARAERLWAADRTRLTNLVASKGDVTEFAALERTARRRRDAVPEPRPPVSEQDRVPRAGLGGGL